MTDILYSATATTVHVPRSRWRLVRRWKDAQLLSPPWWQRLRYLITGHSGKFIVPWLRNPDAGPYWVDLKDYS